MTEEGTVAGSALESATSAPPTSAVPVRVTVPATVFPPTTRSALSESDASAAPAVTVSSDDSFLPFNDAVIVATPVAVVAIAKLALEDPSGTWRGVGTVATAGSLLASEMLTPPAGAAPIRLTTPCTAVPTLMVDELSVTLRMTDVVDGAVGDEERLQ